MKNTAYNTSSNKESKSSSLILLRKIKLIRMIWKEKQKKLWVQLSS